MKNPECRDAAYRFITAYKWIDHAKDQMRATDWFGLHLEHLNENLDLVSGQFDELRKDGHLTDPQLTGLRVILQDVKRNLPAIPDGEYVKMGEGDRLKQSIHHSEKLMDKLTEVMFESVVDCECKGR